MWASGERRSSTRPRPWPADRGRATCGCSRSWLGENIPRVKFSPSRKTVRALPGPLMRHAMHQHPDFDRAAAQRAAEQTWASSPAIRVEFGSKEEFIAYRIAVARGQCSEGLSGPRILCSARPSSPPQPRSVPPNWEYQVGVISKMIAEERPGISQAESVRLAEAELTQRAAVAKARRATAAPAAAPAA